MSDVVSVVVPTRNSAATLAACLASVRAQTHAPVECLVVDNHSADGTAAIAAGQADRLIVAGPERSTQRNVGARAATGAHLLFVDSDMLLDPEVVAQAVARARAGAAAVVVPEESFGEGFWAQVKALERSCYLGDETIEAARFFRRDAFEAAGGYDESIYAAEDWDLHARVRGAGWPTARTEAFIRHDEGRLALSETMRTKYYYGKSAATYLRRHSDQARAQVSPLRPAFLRHWRRLARRPVLAAALVVLKVCELGAGAAGVLVARAQASPTAA